MERHEHDLLNVSITLLVLIELGQEHQYLSLNIFVFLIQGLHNVLKVFESPLHSHNVGLAVLVTALTSSCSELEATLSRHDTEACRGWTHANCSWHDCIGRRELEPILLHLSLRVFVRH